MSATIRSFALTGVIVGLAGCGGPAPTPEPEAPKRSLFEDEGKAQGSAEGPTDPLPEPNTKRELASHELEFTDVSAAWGVDEIRHHAGRNPDKWLPETTNAGIALIDVNRDGALDILFVDGGNLGGAPVPGTGPRLLLGDGKGEFEDVSAAWGLSHAGYGMGVAAGDIDNDGWIDLYLTTYDAKDRLLRNDAGQGFVDVTEAWGIEPEGWSTSAAFLDMDLDGDLDLYVARYVHYPLAESIKCWFRTIHIYCTPAMYEAQTDLLYRNESSGEGPGHFVEAADALGVSSLAAKGFAIGTGDLDDDGDTDIYVANDISSNLLWINMGGWAEGRGRFEESGVLAGVAYSELGKEEASMGVAIADADADGRWDLAVTNFQAEPTSLYVRRESGSYRERSDAVGIGASSRARLAFGIEWIDADNDGDEDLITANGHVTDNIESYRENVHFAQQNSLYERVGPGRFVDVSSEAGDAFAYRGVSRGLAVGDLDGDGGLDYVVGDNEGPVQAARNTTAERGHFLSLWLEGDPSQGVSRSAIGARVEIEVGGQTIVREVRGASSYLAVSDRRVHLGLGPATELAQVTIRWPGGQVQELGPQQADRHLWVRQGQPPKVYTPGAEVLPP